MCKNNLPGVGTRLGEAVIVVGAVFKYERGKYEKSGKLNIFCKH